MMDPQQDSGEVVNDREQSRQTRRSFLKWTVSMATGLGAIAWVRTRSLEDGIPWPLRRIHQWNEKVGRLLYSQWRRVREFPPSQAGEPRVNGTIGRPAQPPAKAMTITVDVLGQGPFELSIDQIVQGLPRLEETTELKCIEGWSQVVTWGGVRLSDVLSRWGVTPATAPYIALSTALEEYYVSIDTESAFHPQTLLCDRMNGESLPEPHGGPLRLIIPVKYGIKNIKWIGRIRVMSSRPADYWAERGYDWYAGL